MEIDKRAIEVLCNIGKTVSSNKTCLLMKIRSLEVSRQDTHVTGVDTQEKHKINTLVEAYVHYMA